ncbi:hypothetical protein WALSEDRAFT_36795 [Wallemia mellicola CBS 633.66]|uniref:CBF1-interacting co-repressor CIR N-terminal domain-containing protein n=1 Tax=Wallemia mellicola (strain ATCC MYA-4683 / CBS 633.66) TaxID=671144 RepID=I4YFI4_WALMC|nr:hypothetical protein WALSEDRAFT_36795 [Wallemia mellicola CBS 633.66]EIM22726.1 hypothetical protein WALSEDRAFT_36795 [Wallemia mellicola CBS 633.66]TIC55654.1 hypothetical protein E3Q05_02131 [Wallemia mellicola]|eukprot:XP_006957387.1 hypothetical protein WALSEDRAFT_36795 [Wallemia mellicola CBS 633.66]
MGGGDLNMKKSWHPMLMKNQRVVWDKEQEVIQENKKLDQLRREKQEERQLQELQKLQEASSGKKASDRMEWMYAAPATGSGLSANDMEDYLLGKKRVDNILKGNDEVNLANTQQDVIQTQKANTSRDTSSKIREDPLLSIRQQEQAAYEALINNPIRLREMRLKAGIPDTDSKSEKRAAKEERKRQREEKRRLKDDRDDRRPERHDRPGDDHYDRKRYDDRYSRRDSDRYDDRYSRRDDDRYSRRDDDRYSRRDDDRYTRRDVDRDSRRDVNRDSRRHSRRSPDYRDYEREKNRRSISPPRQNRPSPPRHERSHRPSPPQLDDQEARAAKLAAMSSSARDLQAERDVRLSEMAKRDAEENARDAILRSRDAKYGGHNKFIADEQRKVYSGEGGLAEQMRRRG